jgi:sensor histidine kinase YesM
MAFLDANGFETAAFGSRPKMDYSDNLPLIINTSIENRQLFIGTIKKNPVRKTLSLTLAFPAKEGLLGADKGALVAEFNMKPLENDLNEDLQNDYLALIFTKSGFLIYSSDKGLSTTLTNTYKDKIAALSAQSKEGETVRLNDRKYTGILTVNPVTGWIVYTEQPSSMLDGVIWSSAKSSFKSILAVFGAIFLFALFASFYISGLIIRPIKAMTQAVKKVEEGKIN